MSKESRKARVIVQHLRSMGAKDANSQPIPPSHYIFLIKTKVDNDIISVTRSINFRDLHLLQSPHVWAENTYELWVAEAEAWENKAQGMAMLGALGK